MQQLQSHLAPQAIVDGQVHHALPAGAEATQETIGTDPVRIRSAVRFVRPAIRGGAVGAQLRVGALDCSACARIAPDVFLERERLAVLRIGKKLPNEVEHGAFGVVLDLRMRLCPAVRHRPRFG